MATSSQSTTAPPLTQFEMIDTTTLAERWHKTCRWVETQSRAADDPLPHIKLGRTARFLWNSPELNEWLVRRYRR